MPTGLGFTSLDEMTLMVLIAERAEDVSVIGRSRSRQRQDSDFIAATGYAAQPLAEPYVYAHEDIVGMFVGHSRCLYLQSEYCRPTTQTYELPPLREESRYRRRGVGSDANANCRPRLLQRR